MRHMLPLGRRCHRAQVPPYRCAGSGVRHRGRLNVPRDKPSEAHTHCHTDTVTSPCKHLYICSYICGGCVIELYVKSAWLKLSALLEHKQIGLNR